MSATHRLSVSETVPDHADPDHPVVVLVHGSLDRAASFSRVRRRLGDLHTVVYDRRGYQGSRQALPLNTTLEGHVDDLLAVVGGRPSVVVGHSYGGAIALGAALREDSPIVAVAAYEPPMPWLAEWPRSVPDPAPVPGRDPAGQESADMAAERFFRRMVGDGAWDRLSEEGKRSRWDDGPALAAELAAIRLDHPPFDVTSLGVPSVFGRGGNSVGRHRDAVTWLVEHTPGAALFEIDGASHGAHLTHPDGFAALVRATLARAGQPLEPSL
jgi:pimeloyl-ACP methyl ester carboxylesterase